MSLDESKYKLERKFLHDLATPMTVMRSMIKKSIADLSAEGAPADVSKLAARLAQALKSLEDVERLHADRKAEIFNLEQS